VRKKRERGSDDKIGGKEKRNNWWHKMEGKVKAGKEQRRGENDKKRRNKDMGTISASFVQSSGRHHSAEHRSGSERAELVPL
jgi:hypothetical protein